AGSPPPNGSQPLPTPRPVEGDRAPKGVPPDVWGATGPHPVPADLPTAPPELMHPPSGMVAPGKHGVCGSPPLRLSCDYPALIGPGSLGDTFRPGFRARGGAWVDDCGSIGIDGSYFFLARRSGTTTLSSAATPVLTRPFFAPNPGVAGEFGQLVALPGSSVGA